MIVKMIFYFRNLDYSLCFSVIFCSVQLGFFFFLLLYFLATATSIDSRCCKIRALLSSPSWVAQEWMNVLCLCLDFLSAHKRSPAFFLVFLAFLFMDALSLQVQCVTGLEWYSANKKNKKNWPRLVWSTHYSQSNTYINCDAYLHVLLPPFWL